MEEVGNLDYEFEAEALADFYYSASNGIDNNDAERQLMRDFQASVVSKIGKISEVAGDGNGNREDESDVKEYTIDDVIRHMKPKCFTKGRNMYS